MVFSPLIYYLTEREGQGSGEREGGRPCAYMHKHGVKDLRSTYALIHFALKALVIAPVFPAVTESK